MKYTAEELLTRAKTNLIMDKKYVFFSTLTLRLMLVEDKSIPTACTDGKVIRYNPQFIESLDLDEVKFVLAHEAGGHCGLSHHTRRGSRDPKKWNYAADYVVNAMLKNAGFRMPKDGLYDQKFDGMSTEEVYNLLPDPKEGDNPDPGNCGGVVDAPKEGNESQKQANERSEAQWKLHVASAYEAARMAGHIPVGIDRMVEELIDPKLDWRIILRRFVEESVASDYSWSPPNRRYIHMGLYLPGVKKNEAINGEVAVDLSGSMGRDEVAEAAGELSAIFEQFRATVDVHYFDTKVHKTEHFEPEDYPLELHPMGGGGTDPRCVMNKIEKEGRSPKFLIIFTDMDFNQFGDAPPYPVLWVMVGRKRETIVPYGELVMI